MLWAENTTLILELKIKEFANAVSWKYNNSLMLWSEIKKKKKKKKKKKRKEKKRKEMLMLWAESTTNR